MTTCAGFQMNVTCFWGAKLARYTFPEPGFQVFAREVIWRTKQGWKRLRGTS